METNCDSYGGLYDWDELMDYNMTIAAQGICPDGWHVPTIDEFTVLANFLGGGSVAGGKLKSTRTEPLPHPRWNSPNTGATNISGFTALPAGGRPISFGSLGNSCSFWTSNRTASTTAYLSGLSAETASFYLDNLYSWTQASSARCLKD